MKQEVDYGELEEGELKMTMEESYEGSEDDIEDYYDEELECESIFDDPEKCNPDEISKLNLFPTCNNEKKVIKVTLLRLILSK